MSETGSISIAVNSFGLNLFRQISGGKTGKNEFLSPFSISVALAMTQLGADGDTALSMSKTLQWADGNDEAIHENFQKYLTLLHNSLDSCLLSTANRIYMEENFHVTEEFKSRTKDCYNAEATPAQFSKNTETERVKINRWVSEQTQEKIQNLIGEGALSADTRMVLVNAIYFKGQWKEKFRALPTHRVPFKISPTESKTVQMMSAKRDYQNFVDHEDLKCHVLDIPYKGDNLSMVVFLPLDDFGLQEVEQKLTSEKLDMVFGQLEGSKEEVSVTWPKFEMTSSFKLSEPLSTLGMASAFDPSAANFSKMTGSPTLFLSEVLHKAFIKVDQEGTEAAAATAAVMSLNCYRPPSPSFVADHPFLFLIRDRRAGNVVLFMGQVAEPSFDEE